MSCIAMCTHFVCKEWKKIRHSETDRRYYSKTINGIDLCVGHSSAFVIPLDIFGIKQ